VVDTCFLVELVGRRECGDALVLALHALLQIPSSRSQKLGYQIDYSVIVNDLKYLGNALRQRTCYHHGKPFSFSPPKNELPGCLPDVAWNDGDFGRGLLVNSQLQVVSLVFTIQRGAGLNKVSRSARGTSTRYFHMG